MEFCVTPSFCLWELMFSLGRENTLWELVCLGWAAKLNAALSWIVIPFFLWRDFCQFEKGGGFPLPHPFQISLSLFFLFLQGRRGERWLDSLALIIPGLILSACVYLKRTASHLPCAAPSPHIPAWVRGEETAITGVHKLHTTAARTEGRVFVLEVLLDGGWARLAGEQLVNRPSAGFVYLAEWIVRE